MKTVEDVMNLKLKNAVMRMFNNRAKWEPLEITKSLPELTSRADQLHYKLAREILPGKLKYYFLFHEKDLEEGLLRNKEYFFTEGNTSIIIGKFTYGDVYCATVTVNIK